MHWLRKTGCWDREKLKACAECRIGLFCVKECQREDWERHKVVCKKAGAKDGGNMRPGGEWVDRRLGVSEIVALGVILRSLQEYHKMTAGCHQCSSCTGFHQTRRTVVVFFLRSGCPSHRFALSRLLPLGVCRACAGVFPCLSQEVLRVMKRERGPLRLACPNVDTDYTIT